MQYINKSFQSNNTNPTKLLQGLVMAIKSLQTKIISPEINIDILTNDFESIVKRDLYLGYEFENEIKILILGTDKEKEVRERCTNFVVELAKQLNLR